jgi:hypothetical protein
MVFASRISVCRVPPFFVVSYIKEPFHKDSRTCGVLVYSKKLFLYVPNIHPQVITWCFPRRLPMGSGRQKEGGNLGEAIWGRQSVGGNLWEAICGRQFVGSDLWEQWRYLGGIWEASGGQIALLLTGCRLGDTYPQKPKVKSTFSINMYQIPVPV